MFCFLLDFRGQHRPVQYLALLYCSISFLTPSLHFNSSYHLVPDLQKYITYGKVHLKLCSSTCSPGIMLLIYEKTPSFVPLQILSIEDGTVLKTFNHLLHKNKKVDFIEQFNEKLLVKQENENLQILDVSMFFDLLYVSHPS
jgi:hypothetical protein